jgi:hypothetical protein
VSEKYLPIEDLCKLLSKATGERFEAEPKLRSRKLALFCSKRSASEVMWAVEKAIDCRWTITRSKALRLELTDAERKRESQMVSRDRAHVGKAMRSILDEFVRMSDEPIDRMLQRIRQTSPGGSRSNREDMAIFAGLGRPIAGHQEEISKSLLNGDTVYASTSPIKGFLLLPDPFVYHWYSVGDENGNPAHGSGFRLALRFSTEEFQLQGRGAIVGIKNRVAGGNELNVDLTYEGPSLADTSLKEWGKTQDEAVLRTAIPQETDRLPERNSVPFFSVADHLEQLASLTEIPVCAESFRRPCSSEPMFPGLRVSDWLSALNSGRPKLPIRYEPGQVRTESGWLMMRQAYNWRLHAGEPPEALVKRMEAKSRNEPLTLEDYAAFTAGLNDIQLTTFQAPRLIVCGFSTAPILHAGEFLSVWSHLNQSEREMAAGDGLSLDSLSKEQQGRFAWLTQRILWTGRTIRENLLPYFMPVGGDTPPLRFFYRLGKVSRFTSRPGSPFPQPLSDVLYSFSLGTSADNAVSKGVQL